MHIGQQPTTEEILAEINRQFGFIPSFFTPALSTPQLLENLWQQMLSGYINNPLPSLFKEQLLASLSRYCHVHSCLVYHSCALHATGMTAQEILALLEAPLPGSIQMEQHLALLAAESGPLTEWPERGSALEQALLASAIDLFVRSNAPLHAQESSSELPAEQIARSRSELKRVLGESYHYLSSLLAYVKWQHFWIESHPEISLENDQPVQEQFRLLLDTEPRLAGFFEMHGNGGAPIRGEQEYITGAVTINRDVAQQRQLAGSTHETLNALLEMAEAMVQTSERTNDFEIPASYRSSTASAVGHRLAELTCSVLGCSRVGISAVEPETEMTRAVAVVGLAPEQEERWWIEQEQQAASLRDNPMPELIARLRANEILLIDMTKPPFNASPNPYEIYSMLVAPMCVGNELVGLLTLDYGAKEHTYTPDEMALAQAVARLGALVIERERLLHKQAKAQASIIALSDAKRRMDDFLSMASHELRTPLTSVKGNIQMAERRLGNFMRKESGQNEQLDNTIRSVHEMLERADRQIRLLNRLVGDLLDVSRIQASKLEMRVGPFDLASVTREAVQEQRQAHPARTITLELPQEAVPVTGDADRIGQVVTNFLTNALKYSDADGPVDIRLRLEGENALLRVHDEGPGLPPEELERIWERFYQAPGIEVRSGSGVGLGLGLHISKTIIERHQGQIGVESTVGKGSTFWFTLPLAL